jgi:hypothetical protein
LGRPQDWTWSRDSASVTVNIWAVSNTEIKLTEILEFEPDSTPLEQSYCIVNALQRCKDEEMGEFHICFESLCAEWSLFRRVSPLYEDLLAATVFK